MAGIIPKRVIEDVRMRSDIVDVVGSYVTLKRAGATLKACCPFHKEKTPSFIVSPERQTYHCFGCGVGGDVFKFLMEYEGVDFVGAVQLLGQRAGVTVEMDGDSGDRDDKALLYKIHSELAELYHKALLDRASAQVAREYLKERELSMETASDFLIGYAPDRWDAVLTWAQRKKYPLAAVEKAGLILPTTKPNARSKYYDRFRGRLMFPIRDQQGRVIAFSGRTITKDSAGAKYVNSPETPLFHKSRVLYAMEKARRPITQAREAIICEGQIDVIRCHQAGFDRAVASQGTAFTEDHARILGRHADSVVIVFDPDTAGENAAIKTAGVFIAAGLVVRVASLPAGEDPDSFIRAHGAEAFQAVLDASKSAVHFQVDVLQARGDRGSGTAGVRHIIDSVFETILAADDQILRDRLMHELGTRFASVDMRAIHEELKSKGRKQSYVRRRPESEDVPAVSAGYSHPTEELALCEAAAQAAHDSGVAELVLKYLPASLLQDPMCRGFLEIARASFESGTSIKAMLGERENPPGSLHQFTARVENAPSKTAGGEHTDEDAVRGLILRVWRNTLRRERDSLPPDQEERRSQITYDLNALRNWDAGEAVISIELAMKE